MKNFWKIVTLLVVMILPVGIVSCSGDDEEEIAKTPIITPTPEPEDTTTNDNNEPTEVKVYKDGNAYANFFAYNVMGDVYLWKKEINSSLNTWGNQLGNAINKGTDMPDAISKVENIRYKNSSKEDIDKWSMLTDDYSSFTGSVDGVVTTTYGCSYKFYLKEANSNLVVAFVTYVYPESPAEKAGLQRGDVILGIDGKDLDLNNYINLYYSSSMEVTIGKLDTTTGAYVETGKTASMTAVNMYENPVFLSKTFDCGGKKVGYLVFHSFTLDACEDLIAVAKQFKQEGVTELILDLRYNGGGYVITENVLASMLAPEANVKAKDVFQTEVWNDDYMEYYQKNNYDLNTYFQTEWSFEHNEKKYELNTSDTNLGLTKIYALVASGSASASESVLVGLMPYVDVEVIGEQTHGKYCTGWILSATDWYESVVENYDELSKKNPTEYGTFSEEFPWFAQWETYAANWGIYVMISRYADKNGENPCMPDGLTPDVEASDRIYEPYALGDEREWLLYTALQKAGKTDLPTRAEARSAMRTLGKPVKDVSRNPLDGKLIHLGKPMMKAPLLPMKIEVE